MLKEDLHDISINTLFESGKISVRATNCCHIAGFKTLFDILTYYEEGKSFKIIRNAGQKLMLELENLCKATLQDLSPTETTTIEEKRYDVLPYEDNETIIVYEALSKIRLRNLDEVYKKLIKTYSNRIQNRLSIITLDDFVKNYLCYPDDKLLEINGFGEKCLIDSMDFKQKIKAEINNLYSITDDELQKREIFSKYGKNSSNEFAVSFFDDNNHYPMFWIFEQEINQIESRDLDILKSSGIFNNTPVTSLSDCAKKHSITRERVRQIRIATRQNLLNSKILMNSDDWSYWLDATKRTITLKSFEIQEYLKKEQCNLTLEFVLQIIAHIFKDKYILLGGIETYKCKKVWHNSYLIKRDFSDVFDFERFREDFKRFLSGNKTDYLLDVEDYITNSQCWFKFDFDKSDNISSIVRDILLYEFQLSSENIDGKIKIPAPKHRVLYNVIYGILKAKGEPMHINDILIEFKKILPEHQCSQKNNLGNLRQYLQKHDDIAYRKRESIYLLKEWEHIKSGTIRNSIIDFLIDKDFPQSSDNIAEYILQYFPETNSSNIRTTMFSDTLKRFSFFQGDLFGLAYKDYPSEYELKHPVQKKSFEQRLADLEKFIVENEHFPFSRSEDKDEESLHRWWNKIVRREQTFNRIQLTEIERIKTNYADFKNR